MNTSTDDAAEQGAAGHRRTDDPPPRRRVGGGASSFAFGPLLVPKREAFDAIGVGHTKGYELINASLLVARKQGTRTMIEAESLRVQRRAEGDLSTCHPDGAPAIYQTSVSHSCPDASFAPRNASSYAVQISCVTRPGAPPLIGRRSTDFSGVTS